MNELKVMYFDIETSPCLAEVWGTGKQYVSAEQIVKERKILCIAYKFALEKKVHIMKMDLNKHKLNKFDDDADKQLLKQFSKIYNSADMAIAHNGRKFDLARIRARLVKYGLPDLKPILFDDSYVFSKDKNFTSHKLDYLCKYLGLPRKTHTGRQLWSDIMLGSKPALEKMVEYCANDVLILEQMYNKLKPYSASRMNLAVIHNDEGMCPSCGDRLHKRGVMYSATAVKQRYQCTNKKCMKWSHCGENLVQKTTRLPR